MANQPEQRRLDDEERPGDKERVAGAPIPADEASPAVEAGRADEAIQRDQAAEDRAQAAEARREARASGDPDSDERELLADLREREADERERLANLREAAADERDRQWAAERSRVATHYYRMSDTQAIEDAMRRLGQEADLSPARLLGYANQHILQVDHPPGRLPDAILRDIDPRARRLPEPPAGPN